jgi:hypothetical protein
VSHLVIAQRVLDAQVINHSIEHGTIGEKAQNVMFFISTNVEHVVKGKGVFF